MGFGTDRARTGATSRRHPDTWADRRVDAPLRRNAVLRVLGQFDHVSVEVLISCASTPGFVSWVVEYSGTSVYGRCMSRSDVFDRETDLSASSGPPFGGVEGEMKIGALCPGDLCVDSADPTILDSVVAWSEIDPNPSRYSETDFSKSETSKMTATNRLSPGILTRCRCVATLGPGKSFTLV